jgi:hypothetical protein
MNTVIFPDAPSGERRELAPSASKTLLSRALTFFPVVTIIGALVAFLDSGSMQTWSQDIPIVAVLALIGAAASLGAIRQAREAREEGFPSGGPVWAGMLLLGISAFFNGYVAGGLCIGSADIVGIYAAFASAACALVGMVIVFAAHRLAKII